MNEDSEQENTARDQRAARGEATRARLLVEAMRLFAERGYDGVSIRALAAAADANVALITFHFGSKRGLYDAALAAVERRLAEVIRPVAHALDQALATHADSPDQLMKTLRDLLADTLGRLLSDPPPTPGFFQLLAREMHEKDFQERLWRTFVPMMRGLEQVFLHACPADRRENPDILDRAQMAAFLLIDTVLGIVRLYPLFRVHLSGDRRPENDAALLAELVFTKFDAMSAGFPSRSPAGSGTETSLSSKSSRSIPC